MSGDYFSGNGWSATRLSVAAAHEALDRLFTAAGAGDDAAPQERLAAVSRLQESAKTSAEAAVFEVMPHLAGVADAGDAIKELWQNFAELDCACAGGGNPTDALGQVKEKLKNIRLLLAVIDA